MPFLSDELALWRPLIEATVKAIESNANVRVYSTALGTLKSAISATPSFKSPVARQHFQQFVDRTANPLLLEHQQDLFEKIKKRVTSLFEELDNADSELQAIARVGESPNTSWADGFDPSATDIITHAKKTLLKSEDTDKIELRKKRAEEASVYL